MNENWSTVTSVGKGKRQATRKPTGSESHIRPVGCALEPLADEHGTTERTTRVVPCPVFATFVVVDYVNGNMVEVTTYPFRDRDAANADATRRNIGRTKRLAFVQLRKS